MTHDELYNNTPLRGEIPLDRVCTMTITDTLILLISQNKKNATY